MIPWLGWSPPPAPLGGLEPTPDRPLPCADLRPDPPDSGATFEAGGYAVGEGWVRSPDGVIRPLPGTPRGLAVGPDGRALIALGWLGAVEVGQEVEWVADGELVDAAEGGDAVWLADRRGRVVRRAGGHSAAVEVPGWPTTLLADASGVWVALGWGGLGRLGGDPPGVVQILRPGTEVLALAPTASVPEVVEPPPPIPWSHPAPRGAARIGPAGELERWEGEVRSWSVLPPLSVRADQVVLAAERLVASHGRDGTLTIAGPGGVERVVHLDGAVGSGVLAATARGDVWAPLPLVGAQRIDPVTGASTTWRFAPGALEVVDGPDGVLAARGDFGLARLLPDGAVEACHPGIPVDRLERSDDGLLWLVTGAFRRPWPAGARCCRPIPP